MKGIRVTTLSSFYTCAYKYKYDKSDIKVSDTYKWDILNAAAGSDYSVKPFIEYYKNNINPDLKLSVILQDCCDGVARYVREKKEDNPDLFVQERKFVIKYNDDYYIEWTPDLYYQNSEWQFFVEDLKMSTHDWYEHEDSRTYNMQTYIYPLMVMIYYGIDTCSFGYYVFDKKNGKWRLIGPRMRTREECETKLKEVMDMYIESEFTETYSPNKQRACWFCKLKEVCPARNKSKITIEESL